jgi:translation initiation factor 2-alpha kinase 4
MYIHATFQIVFFEMNYTFTTGAGRIAVLEDIRKPGIHFPSDWDAHRTRQRESKFYVFKDLCRDIYFYSLLAFAVITLLLQHEPDKRPTALELSQSPLLPSRVEDEYFKGALRMMGGFHSFSSTFEQFIYTHFTAKPDSPHHQTVLNSLFKQPPRPSRAYLDDVEADPSEYASLNNIVKDCLAAIFHLLGVWKRRC